MCDTMADHEGNNSEATMDTAVHSPGKMVEDEDVQSSFENSSQKSGDGPEKPAALETSTKDVELVVERIPESDFNNGIVGWDSQEDPSNPLNFPPRKKWILITLLATLEFITPLASSMFAPALPSMSRTFHLTSTSILSPMVVTIFLLGFVFGPLFLAPLGEIYGRRPILTVSNIFFVAFTLGCALAPNVGSLIAFRFLAGVGGSGCLAVGGGVIADLFPPHQRGLATAVYSIGPIFGPTVGPVMGGFIAQRLNWRWIYWILVIASGTMTLGNMLFFRETNPQVLIERKVARLAEEMERQDLKSVYELKRSPEESTHGAVLMNGLKRPLKLLFLSPVVFILAIYVALVYGLSFLLFTTLTTVLHDTYGWSDEVCGLAYLTIGLGFIGGLVTVAKISDATVVRMAKANGGIAEPEMRLPACVFFACLVPISFFWYGWAADKGVYWLVTVIGLVPFGFGLIGSFIPAQTYLIDAFPMYSASAVAAMTTSRSLFGAFLALAGPNMNANLGVGWANTLLGFLTLAFVPATAVVARYGKKLRARYPVNL